MKVAILPCETKIQLSFEGENINQLENYKDEFCEIEVKDNMVEWTIEFLADGYTYNFDYDLISKLHSSWKNLASGKNSNVEGLKYLFKVEEETGVIKYTDNPKIQFNFADCKEELQKIEQHFASLLLNKNQIIENPPGITKLFFATPREKRQSLIDTTKGPIILTNITDNGECRELTEKQRESWGYKSLPTEHEYDYAFWYSKFSFYSMINEDSLIKKNVQFYGTCSGKSTSRTWDLDMLVTRFFSLDYLKQIVSIYETEGFITNEKVTQLAVVGFRYSDFVYPKSEEFYNFLISLCDKYNICLLSIISKIYKTVNHSFPLTKGMIILMSKCIERGQKDFLHKYSCIQMKGNDPDFYNFCIQNNLNIVSNIDYLSSLISRLDSKEKIEKAISLYKQNNLYVPNSDFVSSLILRYEELVFEDKELFSLIDNKVLETVLFNGSGKLIKRLLSNGFNFENKIFKIYVACPDCCNGEYHKCNYRKVTSNFVLMTRFENIGIENIKDLPDDDVDEFWTAYGFFDGPACENEVYTHPGVEQIDWDNEKEQRIFKVAPKSYFETETKQTTFVHNCAPKFIIPLTS